MSRAKPQAFERLLAERAGTGGQELAEFGDVYSRSGRPLRSVKAKVSHTARQDAPQEEPGIVEAIAAETTVTAAEPDPQRPRSLRDRKRGCPWPGPRCPSRLAHALPRN